MRRLLIFLLIECVTLFSPVQAQVSLTIKGVKAEQKSNIDAYLASLDESDYSTSLRFRSRLEQQITQALNAVGYYHPQIDFVIEDQGSELVVNIDPGAETLVENVTIRYVGEAQQDEDFIKIQQEAQALAGKRLNHGDYDRIKSQIQSLALSKGYFNGQFKVNRLAISPEQNQAFITLEYDSGVRFHYGEIKLNGTHIAPNRVESLMPFQSGDPYFVNQLGEFNQNLSNTGWFSSVMVQPDLDGLGDLGDLPINVMLTPAARNQLETGIGYSTDVGVRGSLSWNKPWLNSRGHSFTSNFTLSNPEQEVSASYKIPLDDVLNEYYLIQYGLKNVDNLDTQSIESNLALKRFTRLGSGWNRTVSIRYLIENYEQGVIDNVAHFVLPGITFTRTHTQGSRLITSGDKLTGTIEYANQYALSDTDIVHMTGGAAWIDTFADRHRILLRANAGANFIDEYADIPPSLRFFAGGDNSVRGYGYNSISPRDSSGELAGAKLMTTASSEYQYNLYGNWWGAAFFDIGDAYDQVPDWKRGAGVGIRWVSPIGPIRFDVAKPLSSDSDGNYQIHFTIGPEL